MPLEKYFGKEEKIDVKKLAVEEPEKKPALPFDPEKEISLDDWRNSKTYLENTRMGNYYGKWADFGQRAMVMKLLFPERTTELNLKGKDWEEMKKQLETSYRHIGGEKNIINQLMALKILFPEKFSKLKPEEYWDVMKTQLDSNWKNGNADWVGKMKVIFPERALELKIDNVFLDNAKRRLNTLKSPALLDMWALQAMYMKIIFTEEVAELELDSKDWERMKKELDTDRRHNSWEAFLRRALRMKIFAAEKVEITEKGLEIVIQKESPELKTEAPPFPEKRKF